MTSSRKRATHNTPLPPDASPPTFQQTVDYCTPLSLRRMLKARGWDTNDPPAAWPRAHHLEAAQRLLGLSLALYKQDYNPLEHPERFKHRQPRGWRYLPGLLNLPGIQADAAVARHPEYQKLLQVLLATRWGGLPDRYPCAAAVAETFHPVKLPEPINLYLLHRVIGRIPVTDLTDYLSSVLHASYERPIYRRAHRLHPQFKHLDYELIVAMLHADIQTATGVAHYMVSPLHRAPIRQFNTLNYKILDADSFLPSEQIIRSYACGHGLGDLEPATLKLFQEWHNNRI